MFLEAAIAALSALKRPMQLTITSVSKYLIDGPNQFFSDWKGKNWKGVKNADLWQKIDELAAEHDIDWQWIPKEEWHPSKKRTEILAATGKKERKLKRHYRAT